jgi:hypothetical protein
MTPQQETEKYRLRMVALYHNCMAAAAFKREDALDADEESETEALCLRREAMAYEQLAGWMQGPVSRIKQRGGGQ